MALNNNYYVGNVDITNSSATGRMTPSGQMSANDDAIKNKNWQTITITARLAHRLAE